MTIGNRPRVCVCCEREIKARTREPGVPRLITVCLAVYIPVNSSGKAKGTPGIHVCDQCLLSAESAVTVTGQILHRAIMARLLALYRSTLEAGKA